MSNDISEAIRQSTDGYVYLRVWQRDCDMVEATELRKIPAEQDAVERTIDRIWEGREGPVNITFLSAVEAQEFRASERDLVTEAWEDGQRSYDVTPRMR